MCIAAICDNGNACVVAADRQVTVPGLSLEFEPKEPKIDALTDGFVTLSSGNAAVAYGVVRRAQAKVRGFPKQDFGSVVNVVHESFVAEHSARAEQSVLAPRGLSWQTWQADQQKLSQMVVQVAFTELSQFNLRTDVIIAGVDDSGAHIALCHHPQGAGGLDVLDKIGSVAIGSGGPHATIALALRRQHRSSTIVQTVYNVYCAKVTSEIAPGVGEATDMAIISRDGAHNVGDDVLEAMQAMLSKERPIDISANDLDALDDLISGGRAGRVTDE